MSHANEFCLKILFMCVLWRSNYNQKKNEISIWDIAKKERQIFTYRTTPPPSHQHREMDRSIIIIYRDRKLFGHHHKYESGKEKNFASFGKNFEANFSTQKQNNFPTNPAK